MSEDIVVTGLGVVSAIGSGEEAFWAGLAGGRQAAGEVEQFPTADLPRRVACQIREPVGPAPVKGRAAQLSWHAAQEALARAGLTAEGLDAGRVSVVVGTTMGATDFIEHPLFLGGQGELTGEQLVEVVAQGPGSISEQLARGLGFSGTAIDLYGACAAGNMALALARQQLREGRCDAALVGGADGFSFLAFIGFMRARVMAETTCRPFDVHRDGMLVGEGAGMFVLERESSARARGARVRSRLVGCGINAESYHPTRPDPEGTGLTLAVQSALRDAGIAPEEVGYVCAHGTGTPHNDAIELTVMGKCFPRGVAFSSIKGQTGHPMGAASALEAACCMLSLERQQLVPTWNLSEPAESGNLDPVMGGLRASALRFAVNNSAGFGGYNSSVVFAAA